MLWWDMRQPQTEADGGRREGTGVREDDKLLAADKTSRQEQSMSENWWPGLGRWRIGLWLDNAVLELREEEYSDIF